MPDLAGTPPDIEGDVSPESLQSLRARLAAAHHVFVLTGAGMSAESGIPTFRDAQQGYWAQFDPMQLASEEGFRADPERVWRWYSERRDGVRKAQPHAGHLALARFGQSRPGRLTLATQNVDDLHQRAGWPQSLRLHGDILEDIWLDPCPRGRRGHRCDTDWALAGEPPRCQECGNGVRPGVVWFGENLPLSVLNAAEDAARRCDVALVIGTSGVVWPAAGLALTARRSGAWVVVINPHPSELDATANECLRGTAAQLLPALLDALPAVLPSADGLH
jgi:NAD-dependent deacetylase